MSKQKPTKYAPSLAEKKLLEVLLNPEFRLKSITDICIEAKINRCTYYNAFQRDDFKKLLREESKSLIDKHRAAIINSSIKAALRGDSAHTKILLSMSGDYADKMVLFLRPV